MFVGRTTLIQDHCFEYFGVLKSKFTWISDLCKHYQVKVSWWLVLGHFWIKQCHCENSVCTKDNLSQICDSLGRYVYFEFIIDIRKDTHRILFLESHTVADSIIYMSYWFEALQKKFLAVIRRCLTNKENSYWNEIVKWNFRVHCPCYMFD